MTQTRRGPGRPRKAEPDTVLVAVLHPFWFDDVKQPTHLPNGEQHWIRLPGPLAAHVVRSGLALRGPDNV